MSPVTAVTALCRVLSCYIMAQHGTCKLSTRYPAQALLCLQLLAVCAHKAAQGEDISANIQKNDKFANSNCGPLLFIRHAKTASDTNTCHGIRGCSMSLNVAHFSKGNDCETDNSPRKASQHPGSAHLIESCTSAAQRGTAC